MTRHDQARLATPRTTNHFLGDFLRRRFQDLDERLGGGGEVGILPVAHADVANPLEFPHRELDQRETPPSMSRQRSNPLTVILSVVVLHAMLVRIMTGCSLDGKGL